MLKGTLITFSSISIENIDVIISDGKNILLDSNEKYTKTAFTTIRTATHQFCFNNRSEKDNKVNIILKWGPGAYDSSSIANKADLEPLDKLITEINISLKEYQTSIKQMKGMTHTIQEATSSASQYIATFSIFNIITIIVINTLQTIYIKRFFRSRKLV